MSVPGVGLKQCGIGNADRPEGGNEDDRQEVSSQGTSDGDDFSATTAEPHRFVKPFKQILGHTAVVQQPQATIFRCKKKKRGVSATFVPEKSKKRPDRAMSLLTGGQYSSVKLHLS